MSNQQNFCPPFFVAIATFTQREACNEVTMTRYIGMSIFHLKRTSAQQLPIDEKKNYVNSTHKQITDALILIYLIVLIAHLHILSTFTHLVL